jgi:spore germination protein KA
MFFKKKDPHKRETPSHDIHVLFTKAKKSSDFKQISLSRKPGFLILSYYNSLIDQQQLQCKILHVFQEQSVERGNVETIEYVREIIPIEDIVITEDLHDIESKLLKGYAILQLNEKDHRCGLIYLSNEKEGLRKQNNAEDEFTVVGPKVGFIENLDTNVHLLRQQINTPNLIFKEMTIGTMSHTKVVIAYIEGITNEQHVNTVIQRLQNIDFDIVFDSSQLHQMISDNSNTPFPLFLPTERVDKAIYTLISGQVVIITNGSPYVVTGPATLFDFFMSPEDYYLPWVLASFFRLIRILSVIFSIFATPTYIAVLTFHYEMIPKVLLAPLSFSRHNVPFPPVIEAFFLEFTIELLREAGARLPSKVGQTLGIVGGIVIGQASVEAALTSNVLLIIVALSALASFTTPTFKMSNTIRFLRYPFMIFAAIWGGFGIVMGICFLMVHLIRLESLGTPYTVPLYPFRPKDFADTFVRSNYSITTKRPSFLRPKSRWRYHPNDHNKNKNDFDDE